MAKKKIVCLNKVDDEWCIDINYDFFQIYISFPNLNPKLVCTINYADWRRLISIIKAQKEGHENRKQKGEVLWGIGRDRAHYTSIVPQKIILPIGEPKEVKFDYTEEDKKTGLRENISVCLENITLSFNRELFLKFRDSLLAADEVLTNRKTKLTQ